MDTAIIVIVVVVAAVAGWLLLRRRETGAEPRSAVPDQIARDKAPTSIEVDDRTAVVTFDVEVGEDGPDEVMRDLLVRRGREALRGKGFDVDRLSVRAWRGGHVTEIANVKVGVAAPVEDDASAPEAADFDPLGALTNTDFGSVAAVPRSPGDLVPLAKEVHLTEKVRAMLRDRGVDPAGMTMTEMTLALLDASGYTVTEGSVPGTYNATSSGVRTFITVVDHEAGDHPELAEEAVNSFVIRFVSSGADRGLLFSDKYGPFSVYDKEKRQPKIRFITRERVQAFIDSVAMR